MSSSGQRNRDLKIFSDKEIDTPVCHSPEVVSPESSSSFWKGWLLGFHPPCLSVLFSFSSPSLFLLKRHGFIVAHPKLALNLHSSPVSLELGLWACAIYLASVWFGEGEGCHSLVPQQVIGKDAAFVGLKGKEWSPRALLLRLRSSGLRFAGVRVCLEPAILSILFFCSLWK